MQWSSVPDEAFSRPSCCQGENEDVQTQSMAHDEDKSALTLDHFPWFLDTQKLQCKYNGDQFDAH